MVRNGVSANDLDATWRKSSFSGANGGNCVEVADLPAGQVALRNSRHPAGPALVFDRDAITAFLAGVKTAQFDDLT